MNKELVQAASSRKLDVVFLGDDTTEQWNGRWMGETLSPDSAALVSSVIADDLSKIHRLWNKTFTAEGGGAYDGIALGIYGDTVRDEYATTQQSVLGAYFLALRSPYFRSEISCGE